MFVRVSREEPAADQSPQSLEVALGSLLEAGLIAHLVDQLVARDNDHGPPKELEAVYGPIDVGEAPHRRDEEGRVDLARVPDQPLLGRVRDWLPWAVDAGLDDIVWF